MYGNMKMTYLRIINLNFGHRSSNPSCNKKNTHRLSPMQATSELIRVWPGNSLYCQKSLKSTQPTLTTLAIEFLLLVFNRKEGRTPILCSGLVVSSWGVKGSTV